MTELVIEKLLKGKIVEKDVEDLLWHVLRADEQTEYVERQSSLSGRRRLDLLFRRGDQWFLYELKRDYADVRALDQVLDYRGRVARDRDLRPEAIVPCIVCRNASPELIREAKKRGVSLRKYGLTVSLSEIE